MDYTYA
jgi:hypothetical protein